MYEPKKVFGKTKWPELPGKSTSWEKDLEQQFSSWMFDFYGMFEHPFEERYDILKNRIKNFIKNLLKEVK